MKTGGAVKRRTQAALQDFWQRQQQRAQRRRVYQERALARELPAHRPERREASEIYGSRTPHARVEIRRIA